MTVVDRDWWRKVTTLEEMVRHKWDFIEHPGRDIDHDGIAGELGDHDMDEYVLLGVWFDEVVERLRDKASFTMHRHMTVPDWDAFVQGLEDGTAATGCHWSMSRETASPYPEQSKVDVFLTGEVEAWQVDWFTTFQNFFVHPWEEEISFDGPIRLLSVENILTGEVHAPRGLRYPTHLEESGALTTGP